MIKKEDVIEILKTCNDPEIHIDVWTLGLIYDLKINKDKLYIKMTFTTPLCPYGPMLVEEIKSKLLDHHEIKDVNVDVVFEPAWKPSEELRATLGI